MWTCQKCSETNEDSFEACSNCGTSKAGDADPTFRKADDPQFDKRSWAEQKQSRAEHEDVPTHLLAAIVVTLVCIPFGIVAIVYAAQVTPKLAAGDYEGAVQASKSAQFWILVAAGLRLLAILIPVAAEIAGIG